MAKVQIIVDQTSKPAGVAGKAREDLDLGVAVTLDSSLVCAAYRWELIDVPTDASVSTESGVAITGATSKTATMSSPDYAGTYLVRLSVDQGFGIGATSDDIAETTFYAGPTLSSEVSYIPRRIPAAHETDHHNVDDLVEPGGNTDGWAREMRRWFEVMNRIAGNPARIPSIDGTLQAGGSSPESLLLRTRSDSSTSAAITIRVGGVPGDPTPTNSGALSLFGGNGTFGSPIFIEAGDASGSTGAYVFIRGGDGTTGGGGVSLEGGDCSDSSGTAGPIKLTGGNGTGIGNGGNVQLTGGDSDGGGVAFAQGGSILLEAGDETNTTGFGGDVVMKAGLGPTGDGSIEGWIKIGAALAKVFEVKPAEGGVDPSIDHSIAIGLPVLASAPTGVKACLYVDYTTGSLIYVDPSGGSHTLWP